MGTEDCHWLSGLPLGAHRKRTLFLCKVFKSGPGCRGNGAGSLSAHRYCRDTGLYHLQRKNPYHRIKEQTGMCSHRFDPGGDVFLLRNRRRTHQSGGAVFLLFHDHKGSGGKFPLYYLLFPVGKPCFFPGDRQCAIL